MARTALPYDKLVGNASIADDGGTAYDNANGMMINAAEPERTVLRLTNSGGAPLTVTIKAGDYPPAWAAGQGDLVITVAAGTQRYAGPFESGRFVQSNGSMEIDFSANTGTINALQIPKGF